MPRWYLPAGIAATLVAGCGGSSTQAAAGWPLPNGDLASTRAVATSAIGADTVGRLRVAWRFRLPTPLGDAGALTATPVVAGGTVYLQDMSSSVYALELASGRLRWEHRFRAPSPGPNGVAVADGRVYGSTDSTAFALSARSGRLLWQRRLVSASEQFVDIAPLVWRGLVFTSTVGYPPGGRGAIYALDASTGAVRWKLSTIRGRWRHPQLAGGGGAWYPPSVDRRGVLYVGVANPGPWGGSRRYPNGAAFPGRALYTDSLLALDARTGAMRWYDQVTPHDVRDYDFEASPVLARLAVDGVERDVVFGAGKAGIVVAWDRRMHRRLWQRALGRRRHDRGALPYAPVEVCPGLYGGVETPIAYAAGRLFVPVVDLCAKGSAVGYEPLAKLDLARARGELVALDASTGRSAWTRPLAQAPFGCATVAQDVVFTSTFDGSVYALRASDGALLWSARTSAGINSCPAIADDTLLVGAGSRAPGVARPVPELVAYRPG